MISDGWRLSGSIHFTGLQAGFTIDKARDSWLKFGIFSQERLNKYFSKFKLMANWPRDGLIIISIK